MSNWMGACPATSHSWEKFNFLLLWSDLVHCLQVGVKTVEQIWSMAKSIHCCSMISYDMRQIYTVEFYSQTLNLPREYFILAGRKVVVSWNASCTTHRLMLLLWQPVEETPTTYSRVQWFAFCSVCVCMYPFWVRLKNPAVKCDPQLESDWVYFLLKVKCLHGDNSSFALLISFTASVVLLFFPS